MIIQSYTNMAETIDSFNFKSLELENSWDVSPFSDNERARIIHIGFFFPTIKVNGNFGVIQNRQGKYNLAMYLNLEFFDKLKLYFKNNLGLKNVTVGEPRTFISGKSYPADWNMSINAKIGSDGTCDESDSAWESVDEKEPKKRIRLEGTVNKRFRGSCIIAVVDVLITKLYTRVNLEVG